MTDDDLARRLRDAIPDPGQDYWARIDAMLDRVAADDDSSGSEETDGGVSRPTVMQLGHSTTSPSQRRRAVVLSAALAAAAAVTVVALQIAGSQQIGTTHDIEAPAGVDGPGTDLPSTTAPANPTSEPTITVPASS